jgi:hypothetical protein
MPPISRRLPIAIDIPAPCSEAWKSMAGSERTRHCARCDRQIHNLSVLSEAEIAELASRADVCVSLEVKGDGTLVTAEPARDERRARARRVVLTAALTALAACNPDHAGGEEQRLDSVASTSVQSTRRAIVETEQPASTLAARSQSPPAPSAQVTSLVRPPPPRRMQGAPRRADPLPVVHKVGKMMRVPDAG